MTTLATSTLPLVTVDVVSILVLASSSALAVFVANSKRLLSAAIRADSILVSASVSALAALDIDANRELSNFVSDEILEASNLV